MHPAKSVITFTILSGLGYGLLFINLWFGLTKVFCSNVTEFIIMSVAFILITSGLLSATFHLGQPSRAWRALSQWKSSWLSREGISALFLFIPWLCYLFTKYILHSVEISHFFAMITALMCLVTVYTTSMIYRSLKAVQSWYNVYVPPLFLLFSLSSGLVLFNVLLQIQNIESLAINELALLTVTGTILLKRLYWRNLLKQAPRSTLESATGLGKSGKVQVLDQPVSSENYLMQEMGFQIARKHSVKLRKIFQLLWFFAIVILFIDLNYHHIAGLFLSILAFILMFSGLIVERWLFFAEAKHDQALYYQK